MPSAVQNGPPSMQDVEWADLVTLDFSLFDSPNGKQQLAKQLAKALYTCGFFSVKNFSITREAIEQQFKLCRAFFELPLEEKLLYHDKEAWAQRNTIGYKPTGAYIRKINFQSPRHRDNIEIYNIPKQDGYHERPHPKIIQDHMKDIDNFQREVTEKVVKKLLHLVAIILELPDENQLAKHHDFAAKGEDTTRYMMYSAIPIEDSEANNGIYAASHTDITSLTLSFHQPVAGLQIFDSDKAWKWVKPWGDDEIVVNCGDTLTALTGGCIKSGMHRIHAPPREQIHLDRFGVLWFAKPNSDMIMEMVKNSPVLQRMNTETSVGVDQGLTTTEWTKLWIENRMRQDEIEIAKAPTTA